MIYGVYTRSCPEYSRRLSALLRLLGLQLPSMPKVDYAVVH